jgi:hypothetical protein
MRKHQGTPSYIIAAQITFLLATLWVWEFLTRITYGSQYFTFSIRELVFSGLNGDGEIGAFGLFVVVTRYLISFGVIWPLLTWLLTFIAKKKEAGKVEGVVEEQAIV